MFNNLITTTAGDYYYTTSCNNNCGEISTNNKNNKMKEQKLTKQKVVFRETLVKEHVYECLAESHEALLKMIEDGNCSSGVTETISKEVVEVK